jgi:hypothetical protein
VTEFVFALLELSPVDISGFLSSGTDSASGNDKNRDGVK